MFSYSVFPSARCDASCGAAVGWAHAGWLRPGEGNGAKPLAPWSSHSGTGEGLEAQFADPIAASNRGRPRAATDRSPFRAALVQPLQR